MTRAHKLGIAGRAAIVAALMGGSTLSFAQETAPVATPNVVAPTPQVTPEPAVGPAPAPAVVPPAAVRTLPGVNDVVNTAAAEEAAAETVAKPRSSPITKAASSAPTRREAVAPVVESPPPSDMVADNSTDMAPPLVDAIEPATVMENDGADIAPVSQMGDAQGDSISGEDLTMLGGLAAALAAIGVGAAFASRRRRRNVGHDKVATTQATPEFVAPRPIREDPVFQQFAHASNPAVAEREVKRPRIMTRPDVPITDPLFSTPVVAGPITDPMFAPKNEVEPPITDPLFVKHDRFVGRARPAPSVTERERELVN